MKELCLLWLEFLLVLLCICETGLQVIADWSACFSQNGVQLSTQELKVSEKPKVHWQVSENETYVNLLVLKAKQKG